MALHLGFYLASWGMYRGSTGLLQKDYQIHIEAVSIIKNYYDLRCSMSKEINRGQIDQLISLKEDLFNYYNQFRYFDDYAEKIKVNKYVCHGCKDYLESEKILEKIKNNYSYICSR